MMKKLVWLAGTALIAACATMSTSPEPAPVVRAPKIKTVGPATTSEAPTVKVVTKESQEVRIEQNKLEVRPIKNPETAAAIAAHKVVGPIVTYAGVARADGDPTDPIGKTKHGTPIFLNHVGSGFIMVIEAKPGFSNIAPARSIFRYDPEDPSKRPDLEIEVDRPLGDGSVEVCDAHPPNFGGVPAISPADFSETKKVSGALNDLSCRFETFIESDSSCTNAPNGDFSFISGDEASVQFCMVVARKWRFPEGDTTVSVRVRDREGNPGPVSKFILRRRPRPTRPPRKIPTMTPTPVRRRP